MKTIILMSGRGSRFKDLQVPEPKPLVSLHGQPLVRWVVENIKLIPNQHFIFICLKEHCEQYRLHDLFQSWGIRFEIISVHDVTEGAACSALLAKSLINNEEELLIANSDQYVLYHKTSFLEQARHHDGFIMSMKASGNKWSYIKLNEEHLVTEVKEKIQISDLGTVGIYYFKQGSSFVTAAEAMILANDRYNHEFYLAPTYNYMTGTSSRIGHYCIGEAGQEMIGLGTSDDFLRFQSDPLSLMEARKIFK